MQRPELTIGPYFVRSYSPIASLPAVLALGVSLEMAAEKESMSLPLFRKVLSYSDSFSLTEVLIPEDSISAVFDFIFHPVFAAETPIGRFIPLESFLIGVYRHYRTHRSIFDVFTELGREIRLTRERQSRFTALTDSAARLGFEVGKIDSFGRHLQVDIDWFARTPETQEGFIRVPTAAIDFRPRADGRLNAGRWYEPREGLARVLFYEKLREIGCESPLMLFTEVGRAELLTAFEWTPLSKMSSQAARAARIAFIRDCPKLRDRPKDLASALKEAGLYSKTTSDWQIAKFIPSLLRAADKI